MFRRLAYWTGGILAVAGICFVVAGALVGDFGRTWDVLSGTSEPWGNDAAVLVPVSVLGYILVPAVLGLAVTAVVTAVVRRDIHPLEEAQNNILDRLEQIEQDKS